MKVGVFPGPRGDEGWLFTGPVKCPCHIGTRVRETCTASTDDDPCAHTPERWMPWATRMKRVCTVDALEGPKGGDKMRIMATLHPADRPTSLGACPP
jgi:hypothetical protein